MSLPDDMLNFRAKMDISQREAAAMANITPNTWNYIERGRQTASKVTEAKIKRVISQDRKEGSVESINLADKAI